jgi:response regulator of citrate/malate metabolism
MRQPFVPRILKVLLVEPDMNAMRELKVMVNNHPRLELGYACRSGRTATNYLKLDRPDFLIMNPALPDVNGFDLVATFVDPPPIIILADRDDYAYFGFRIGAFDYRVKPLKLPQFEMSIGRIFRAIDTYDELQHLRKELGEEPVDQLPSMIK